MDGTGTQQRARRVAGNILIFLTGLVVALSSILKFAGVPRVVHNMATDGFPNGKLTLVATLEILSAALFLLPRTRSFGVLILSSFLGGAICTHVQMGEYVKGIGPSILLTLAWIGIWMRHPQAFWIPSHGRPATSQSVSQSTQESWVSKRA
jgi:DoxX-like family